MNRPRKRNAISTRMWREIGATFTALADAQDVRCVVLTGAGKHFTAGIDFAVAGVAFTGGFASDADADADAHADADAAPRRDPARTALSILREGSAWQRAWSASPSAASPDRRGARWLLRHRRRRHPLLRKRCLLLRARSGLGLAADIGGNQRLPKIVGNDSLVREMMLSGRRGGDGGAQVRPCQPCGGRRRFVPTSAPVVLPWRPQPRNWRPPSPQRASRHAGGQNPTELRPGSPNRRWCGRADLECGDAGGGHGRRRHRVRDGRAPSATWWLRGALQTAPPCGCSETEKETGAPVASVHGANCDQ